MTVVKPKSLLISGPMSGLPSHNYPAFFQAEHKLLEAGYTRIYNPARVPGSHDDWRWEDWMRASLGMLLQCEAVALLPGWISSRGARIEHDLARDLSMPIEYVDDWVGYAEAA